MNNTLEIRLFSAVTNQNESIDKMNSLEIKVQSMKNVKKGPPLQPSNNGPTSNTNETVTQEPIPRIPSKIDTLANPLTCPNKQDSPVSRDCPAGHTDDASNSSSCPPMQSQSQQNPYRRHHEPANQNLSHTTKIFSIVAVTNLEQIWNKCGMIFYRKIM